VIAILAALLLPALSRAKAAAQFIKCKSNIRQIGHATRMYVNDYGSYMGGWTETTGMNDPIRFDEWQVDLAPYLEPSHKRVYTNAAEIAQYKGVFRCPSQVVEKSELHYLIGGNIVVKKMYLWATSYGYNALGSDPHPPSNKNFGLGQRVTTDGKRHLMPAREEEVMAPADMIAFTDGFSLGYGNNDPFDAEISTHASSYYPQPRPNNRATRRHTGRLSVLFCDGHVEGMRVTPLLLDYNPENLRKWSKDHEPRAW
jgi:prepilin-type processing-associated H-X9-DG protein